MADVQLAAYQAAGFPVVAIASRAPAHAEAVARRWGIPKVHATAEALIEDTQVEVLDIAFPPDQQPALIRHALRQPHIKAILAQKPLAMDFAEARRLAEEARAPASSSRSTRTCASTSRCACCRQVLDRGSLGEPVIATIEMRAIPHWQPFLRDYDRLTLLNMSIHHLDVLRFLFGDPTDIYTAARPDPRTSFPHTRRHRCLDPAVSPRACWR